MKQSEKLDIILRALYEKRDDRNSHAVSEILKFCGIETNREEVVRLSKKLESDGFITLREISSSRMMARITAEGVEYCEEDSYSNKGRSVLNVTHYIITNSPQANIIVSSNNVSITQAQEKDASKIIEQIYQTMDQDRQMDFVLKQEIGECLEEIKVCLQADRQPKFAFRSLLTMGSEISSIGSLILSLGQVLNCLPR